MCILVYIICTAESPKDESVQKLLTSHFREREGGREREGAADINMCSAPTNLLPWDELSISEQLEIGIRGGKGSLVRYPSFL